MGGGHGGRLFAVLRRSDLKCDNAVQYLRSVLFIGQMYLAMAVVAVGFAPFAMVRRDMALKACHTYWPICALDRPVGWWACITKIRGEVPHYPALVAAKHQSFCDILMIFGAMPNPRFVMKKGN